jgi:ketosteroid isomerase-like protein
MYALRINLMQTARSYIDGFNTNTAEGIIASRTPDCKQIIHPSTVPPPWKSPPRSNEDYQAWIVPGFKMIRNIRLSLVEGQDMLVDDMARKVMLHLRSTGETDAGPYANEYMIVLKMTDDGKLIKEIVEFVDSAAVRDIVTAMQQQQQQQAEAGPANK